ncbi:hypothetical protein G7Y89_g11393 [Cudoniella acicularis]|uniref:Uncharacterized protein n=1 Tax=Cudoniella acicularis TaxID=354080 RepID=A0A8H4RD74_9HELO|nr:hypothetical protein G7Y89_g11393 [Cudoniella acicularis]
MFGCDTWIGTPSIAYPIAGAAVITIQSSASPGSFAGSSTVEFTPTTTTSQSTPPPSSTPTSSVPSGIDTAAAIGGALGGFASVVVAILAVYTFWTKNKKPLDQLE